MQNKVSLCEEKESVKYCIECGADICQSCSTAHTRLRAMKNYRILTQEEKNSSKFVMKSRITYCEEHKDKALKLFCYDCEALICLICHALSHEHHKCITLEQASSEKFQDEFERWDKEMYE